MGHPSFVFRRNGKKAFFVIAVFVVLYSPFVFPGSKNRAVPTGLTWAQRMVDSEMQRRGTSIAYQKGGRVVWGYETGLFLQSVFMAWEKTGRQNYFDYVKTIMDSFVNTDGSVNSYDPKEYNLDQINSGKVVLELYNQTKEEKYKKAAFLFMKQLETHPRTREGGFWHKKIYPWQMWLDGIYMAAPFYAEFSKMFDRPKGFDDVANQILFIAKHTRDAKTGLFYHGWDESQAQKWADPVTGCSPIFWGRAMGWYAMGIVDVLDFLPAGHPKRTEIITLFQAMVKDLVKFQDPETGLWFQVLDQGKRPGNYPEASASTMFVYAMAKGIRLGYLGKDLKSTVYQAYEGILRNLVKTDPDGMVHLTQICKVAGLGGKPYRDGSYTYYINEPKVADDLKGVGPFILASIEMESLRK